MTYKAILAFVLILAGCGPNKELAAEKFDPPLRDRMAFLDTQAQSDSTGESPGAMVEELLIVGICDTTINGAMRKDLISSGAQIILMKGEEFTAKVSSTRMFHVADLEFVRQLRLQKGK